MGWKQVLTAAERYAQLGLVTTPERPDNGKVPYRTGWQNKTVAEGLADVRDAARRGELGNIGIVAGANSGNLFQIDIDGLATYEELKHEVPEVADTWTVLTGSKKGVHPYGYADVLPATTIANGAGDHLEIRLKGQGQQCVAPPSIHPDTKLEYTTLVRSPIRHFSQEAVAAIVAFVEARKPKPAALPDMPAIVVQLPTHPGSKRPYALKALDGMVSEVQRLGNVEYDPQNDYMHKFVGKLAVYARYGDLSHSEVFAAMEGAMRSNGYISAFGWRQFLASFESGWDYGMNESSYLPLCYQLPTPKQVTRLSPEAAERLREEEYSSLRLDLDFLGYAETLGAVVTVIEREAV